MIFWQVADSIDLTGEAGEAKNLTTDMATTVFTLLPIIALVIRSMGHIWKQVGRKLRQLSWQWSWALVLDLNRGSSG